jgi:hypothetical protein
MPPNKFIHNHYILSEHHFERSRNFWDGCNVIEGIFIELKRLLLPKGKNQRFNPRVIHQRSCVNDVVDCRKARAAIIGLRNR